MGIVRRTARRRSRWRPRTSQIDPVSSCITWSRARWTSTGREVLEVGSGRGGGASFVARYLRPSRVVGVDVSPQSVAFCRARHSAPGLSFEVGNAEQLGFAAASFDAILNVESSHCYGDMGAFVREVRRVLRPERPFPVRRFPLAQPNWTHGAPGCWPPASASSSSGTSRPA